MFKVFNFYWLWFCSKKPYQTKTPRGAIYTQKRKQEWVWGLKHTEHLKKVLLFQATLLSQVTELDIKLV